MGLILKQSFFHGFNPTFLSHSKHSKLGFPCFSQDAIFSDFAHMVTRQQRLFPCKVFKGEFAKFCQHDGRANCFSHPKQELEEPLIHYFNSFYFLRVHPNFTGIVCCETYQHVEEVTTSQDNLTSIKRSSAQQWFSVNNERLLAATRMFHCTIQVQGGLEQDLQVVESLYKLNNVTFKHKLLAWVSRIEHHNFCFFHVHYKSMFSTKLLECI